LSFPFFQKVVKFCQFYSNKIWSLNGSTQEYTEVTEDIYAKTGIWRSNTCI